MKAARRDRYGGPDVVTVREVERPTPTVGQVLVRVLAASVNRADLDGLYPRWQFTRLFMGLRRPRYPGVGSDVAGVVEAVGPEVTSFQPGDEVYGDLTASGLRAAAVGAFAEYVCADEKVFREKPQGMTFEEAATLPHSAVIALQALRLRNGRTVRPGDRVLIDGASGSVGPFVVQIARARGAEVTGTSRTEKVEFVRSLGADPVLDYTQVDYTRLGERYDWIVDTDTRRSLLRIRRALRPDGVYVTMAASTLGLFRVLLTGLAIRLTSRKRMGLLTWWQPWKTSDLDTLEQLIADGKVRPMIDRRFRLDEVADALRWVDDGRAKGKVVVTP